MDIIQENIDFTIVRTGDSESKMKVPKGKCGLVLLYEC